MTADRLHDLIEAFFRDAHDATLAQCHNDYWDAINAMRRRAAFVRVAAPTYSTSASNRALWDQALRTMERLIKSLEDSEGQV
jgi:hypothetical protein